VRIDPSNTADFVGKGGYVVKEVGKAGMA
jgi:hypothetical protein